MSESSEFHNNPLPPESMKEITTLIQVNHQEVKRLTDMVHRANCQCLEHAKTIGELLMKVRPHIKHGQWAVWVKNNTAFCPKTAWNYIQIAKNWEQLMKIETISDLTLTKALEELREEKRKTTKDKEKQDPRYETECKLNEYLKALNQYLDHYRIRTLTQSTPVQKQRMQIKITKTMMKLSEFQQTTLRDVQTVAVGGDFHENKSL